MGDIWSDFRYEVEGMVLMTLSHFLFFVFSFFPFSWPDFEIYHLCLDVHCMEDLRIEGSPMPMSGA